MRSSIVWSGKARSFCREQVSFTSAEAAVASSRIRVTIFRLQSAQIRDLTDGDVESFLAGCSQCVSLVAAKRIPKPGKTTNGVVAARTPWDAARISPVAEVLPARVGPIYI